MNFDVKICYDWGKTVTAKPEQEDGEDSSWPSDNVSVLLPKDLQQWASNFSSEETPDICMFLKDQIIGATLSFAACPEAEVFSVVEAEAMPGGVLTFVLDLRTLRELHACLGLAIAAQKSEKK